MRQLALAFACSLSTGALASPSSPLRLDHDTALVDAPAVPSEGTIRVSGSAGATQQGAQTYSSTEPVTGVLNGTVSWTPFSWLSADVGAYAEQGAAGEAARLRFQLLSQENAGVDLSLGTKLKSVGFFPERGEAELVAAVGRRFGDLSLVLDAVVGTELGGDYGQDAELKGYAHLNLVESVTIGVDARSRIEIAGDADEEEREREREGGGDEDGRRYDLTVGPTVSWAATDALHFDALVGVTQPLGTQITSPIALLSASFDF